MIQEGTPLQSEPPVRSRPPTVTITEPPVISSRPSFLVGRATEIAQIHAYAAKREQLCLVVLWGSPVVGKSYLAKEVCKDLHCFFPDRRMQIDLKGVTFSYVGATEARLSVIRQVHPMTSIPATESEILGLYESCFADRKCILVIENVGSAQQVMDLVPISATRLCVLVTTRYDIMLDSMTEALCLRLNPLTTEQGHELLENIAGRELIAAQKPEDVASLLSACDGRALLIQLLGSALAREPSSLPRLLASMANREHKYDFFARTMPFDGFDPDLIQFYLPLGVFRGSFSIEAAEAVWCRTSASSAPHSSTESPCCRQEQQHQEQRSTTDILADLISSSLLSQVPPNRYQLPDILQVHCTRQANATVPTQLRAWRERFVQYHLALLGQLNRLTFEYAQDDAAALFVLEQVNFETAVEYSRHLTGFPLGAKMIRAVEWFIKHNLSPCERGTWQSFLHPDFLLTKAKGNGSRLRLVRQSQEHTESPDHLQRFANLDLALLTPTPSERPQPLNGLPGPLDQFTTLDLAHKPHKPHHMLSTHPIATAFNHTSSSSSSSLSPSSSAQPPSSESPSSDHRRSMNE